MSFRKIQYNKALNHEIHLLCLQTLMEVSLCTRQWSKPVRNRTAKMYPLGQQDSSFIGWGKRGRRKPFWETQRCDSSPQNHVQNYTPPLNRSGVSAC